MRAAYFTGLYPRATDTFIQIEVTGLRALGVEVDTFSVREPGDEHIVGPEQSTEKAQTFYLLSASPLAFLTAHVWLLVRSPLRYLRGLKLALSTSQPGIKGLIYQLIYFIEAGLLAREICKRQISHLHNHIANSNCTVAMLASALGEFSFSFTMHGPHIFFEPMRWRLDEKIRRAKFVACISYFCRSQGLIFVRPEHWEKMPIIRCGVNLDLFQPTAYEQQKGNRLLYVGRLAVEKGLPVVLESLKDLAAKYPDITLTIIGDGADRHFLEDLTEQMALTDHVEFVGYQSQSSVRDYLSQTDIFVLPSFAEGIPVVLMESMAMGVPVVATQIAGISELVESGKNGYLVPPGNSPALTGAVDQLINDPDLRATLGKAGRQKVEQHFNIAHSLTELKAWLTS